MRHRISSFIDLAFHPRSRISSFTAVSFPRHVAGCGSGGRFTSQAGQGCLTAGCAVYLERTTRTPLRVAARISRACTAWSSPRDNQRSVAPSQQGTDQSRASLLI